MKKQQLIKIASRLVKKREKRAAIKKCASLMSRLMRTGQLSGKSLETIFQRHLLGSIPSRAIPGKVDELVKMFPHRAPTIERSMGWLNNLFSRRSSSIRYAPKIPAISAGTKAVQGDIVRMIRQLNQPAKPYAPMEGILKQLAELKKAKGKMAPSSKLNKARFKGLQESGQRLEPTFDGKFFGTLMPPATDWRPLK